jgi:hypothetical protein
VYGRRITYKGGKDYNWPSGLARSHIVVDMVPIKSDYVAGREVTPAMLFQVKDTCQALVPVQ